MQLSIRLTWMLLLIGCVFAWIGVICGIRLLLFPHNSAWHAYVLSALVALVIDVIFLYYLFTPKIHHHQQKISSLHRP